MKTEDKIARVQEILATLAEKSNTLVEQELLSSGDVYVIREVLSSQLKRWQNQQRAYDYHKQQRERFKRAMEPESALRVGAETAIHLRLKLAPGVEPPDPNRPVSRGGDRLGAWPTPDEQS